MFDVGQECLQKVLELRCIDNVLVIIGAKTGFDFANLTEEQSLDILTDFSMNLNVWMKGLSSWNRVFDFYQNNEDFHDQEKRPRLEKIPTFRCTCYRTGENLHKFSSMDVARHVGGKVQEKFGWGVKMKNFDIEYVINVDDNQAYAGIGKKKKLVRFCLHSSYITQNFFHFDEMFTESSKLQFLVLLKKFRQTLFTSTLHSA